MLWNSQLGAIAARVKPASHSVVLLVVLLPTREEDSSEVHGHLMMLR